MSDLWIILVLLGVAIVLGVVLFNWWQERKYRSRVEHHFKNTRRDVLIDDFEINTDVLKHEKDVFLDASSKQVVHDALDEATIISGLSEEVEGWTSEPRKVSTVKNETEKTNTDKSKPYTRSNKQTTPNLFEDADALSDNLMSHQAVEEDISNPFKQAALDSSSDELLKSGTISLEDEGVDDSIVENDGKDQTIAKLDQLPQQLHTQMDLIAVLYARNGATSEQLKPLLAELNTFEQNCFALAKPKEGAWVDLKNIKKTTLGSFEQVVFSLQLADRSGAVDRAIIFRFQNSIETLGMNMGLHVEWHAGIDALQQAQQIDQFCIEVDKAVEFHVVANQSAFHATKFRGLAEASGMSLSEEGKYELRNVEGHLNFCIRNFEGKPFSADMLKTAVMTGFTFQLDIPTVAQNTQVFDQMINIAQSMAISLEGVIIDVNRRPIGEVQLEKIRQQLNVINATMIAKGIIPGSPQALRLFS